MFCFIIATGALSAEVEYERVLVPLSLTDVAGAHATRWTSSVVVLNENDTPVPALNFRHTDVGIPAQYYGGLAAVEGSSANPGVYVYIEKGRGSAVTLRNLVFEASHGGAPVAVLPVVREADFDQHRFHLIELQSDEAHRVLLRIYDRDGKDGALARIRVFDNITKTATSDVVLRLSAPRSVGLPAAPAYAQMSDFPSGSRFRIEVEPMTPNTFLWGFATITSREGGNVTLVLPGR